MSAVKRVYTLHINLLCVNCPAGGQRRIPFTHFIYYSVFTPADSIPSKKENSQTCPRNGCCPHQKHYARGRINHRCINSNCISSQAFETVLSEKGAVLPISPCLFRVHPALVHSDYRISFLCLQYILLKVHVYEGSVNCIYCICTVHEKWY